MEPSAGDPTKSSMLGHRSGKMVQTGARGPSELTQNKCVWWCLLLLEDMKSLCSCCNPKDKGDSIQIILLYGTIELWMGQRRHGGWVPKKNEPFIRLQSSTVSHPQANTDLTI